MKRTFLLFALLLPTVLFAQDWNEVAHDHLRTNRQGMYILGSWGLSNIAGGTTAWLLAEESEAKYFHQLNAGWNLVNVGLALGGVLGTKKQLEKDFDAESFPRMQGRNTRIYLFNAGIDFAYITGGFLLREMAVSRPDQANRLRGYGNSLILQGGFLLVFDATMAWVSNRPHKSNRASLRAIPGGFTLAF